MLKAASATAGGALAGFGHPNPEARPQGSTSEGGGPLPVVFISHGSPMVAVESDAYTKALRRLGEDLPLPRAIVVVSAHGESPAPLRVTGSEKPPIVYDFFGFPEELYRLRYPSPGNPDLGSEIVELLSQAGFEARLDPARGLDHGAWVPMLHAYPDARVPLLEVTLPVPRKASELLKIGQALAPLRSRGVLLVGSGGVVHNLGRLHWGDKNAPVDPWARRFDDWIRARLEKKDREEIRDYSAGAPESKLAVPTTEHFDPLFFVLGAAAGADRVVDVYEGFQYGNLSMRTFALR